MIDKVVRYEPYSIAHVLELKHADVTNFIETFQKLRYGGWAQESKMDGRIDKFKSIKKVFLNQSE